MQWDIRRYVIDRLMANPKVKDDVKGVMALAEEYIRRAKYPETMRTFVDEYLKLSCGLEPRDVSNILKAVGNLEIDELKIDHEERARRILRGGRHVRNI